MTVLSETNTFLVGDLDCRPLNRPKTGILTLRKGFPEQNHKAGLYGRHSWLKYFDKHFLKTPYGPGDSVAA
jgi:hypothetical protein